MPQAPLRSRAIVITEIEAMGGAERSVLALTRWLHGHNIPCHVLTYADHVGLAQHADHPLPVVELRPTMRARHKIASLRRYFAARPEAPHPLMSGYQPALHATLAGLHGFHCLMHDTPSLFEDPAPPSFKRRVARVMSDRIVAHGLRSGGRTIVTSEYLRQECRRAFHVEADIARMGGLRGATSFHPRHVSTRLQMLSVSRIESNKRIDWILRALSALEAAHPPLSSRVDWHLDLVGRGSALDAMQEIAASLGLAHRVRFHGYVSDVDLEQLYNRAHLFLMPAVQGYGIPAIEALTRGIPILLHRDSGVSDILLSTPWAVVIEGAEDAMLSGLNRAIRNALSGAQLNVPPPLLPTEEDWAERVVTLCRWL
jgi:glycosyltransferase involved in cell wall biosynthesis